MVSDSGDGSNRSIIAALGLAITLIAFGLGVYATALWLHQKPAQIDVQSQQAKAQSDFYSSGAAAIKVLTQPAEKDWGCQEGRDDRNSDLCAQWKAADAASKAAQYALFTLIISAVGTGLLVWTLWETRQTSRRELRAYLVVEPKGVTEAYEGYPYGSCIVSIKNCGQTPAYGVSVAGAVAYDDKPAEVDASDYQDIMVLFDSDHALGPGELFHVHGKLEEMSMDLQSGIRDQLIALIQCGTVRYTDAFGRSRFTNYSFFHWGDELSDGNAKRCRKWNNAN